MVDKKRDNILLVLLTIITLFVVGIVLNLLSSILVPLALAVFFSILFGPLIDFLRKIKVPMIFALLIVVLISGGIIGLFTMIAFQGVVTVGDAFPKYQDRIHDLTQQAQQFYNYILHLFRVEPKDINAKNNLPISVIGTWISTIAQSFMSSAGNALVILLYMLFILGSRGVLADKIVAAFPAQRANKIADIIKNTNKQIQYYLVMKTIINLAIGLITWITLALFGVDFAFFWGLLFFLLHYIPNIGSLLGIGLVTALTFMQFDGLVKPIVIVVVLLLEQNIAGNIIEPKLMASGLNLSPLVILVSLLFWGWLWGVWGMILSVPITTVIKIICENFDGLRFISVLMSEKVKEDET